MSLNLVLSNKSSVLNKKLIKFFQINLLSLNKASLVFQFEVAHPDDMNKYVARGIKNYPVLIHNNTNIIGVEKIIEYLKIIIKKFNAKILNKSDTDHVDDFWKQTLGKIQVNDSGQIENDDDDESDDLHKKIQQAFQDRNTESEFSVAQKKPRVNNVSQGSSNNVSHGSTNISDSDESPSSTLKNMKSKGGDMDDDLMAKFFENQEESN
jgi:hypothetical protein